ncbi:hypothetical protein FM104_10950 [Microbacterium esteraromaticum]|uniref:Uncharacterized protein n=1 Tax=Microbacterium esteraromaticum TaxID=57043 RepID=A0A1R4K7U2_9MICO|nr:hypothetical protein FM104_10950 [Microbacterium esteraromaticum]
MCPRYRVGAGVLGRAGGEEPVKTICGIAESARVAAMDTFRTETGRGGLGFLRIVYIERGNAIGNRQNCRIDSYPA